jgi:hypothetical protein
MTRFYRHAINTAGADRQIVTGTASSPRTPRSLTHGDDRSGLLPPDPSLPIALEAHVS